jgi:hypothetical protein
MVVKFIPVRLAKCKVSFRLDDNAGSDFKGFVIWMVERPIKIKVKSAGKMS